MAELKIRVLSASKQIFKIFVESGWKPDLDLKEELSAENVIFFSSRKIGGRIAHFPS